MTRMHKLSALAASASLVAFPALASPQDGVPYAYYGDHMWGGGWAGLFIGPLMMVIWIALLVGAVVLILRWIGAPGQAAPKRNGNGPDAMDLLRERFAKGEIDKAEFEERRALLER